MNRRQFLQFLGISLVVPFLPTIPNNGKPKTEYGKKNCGQIFTKNEALTFCNNKNESVVIPLKSKWGQLVEINSRKKEYVFGTFDNGDYFRNLIGKLGSDEYKKLMNNWNLVPDKDDYIRYNKIIELLESDKSEWQQSIETLWYGDPDLDCEFEGVNLAPYITTGKDL